jgi:uncharacterized protein involved in exopolysaccharide biosynthesis
MREDMSKLNQRVSQKNAAEGKPEPTLRDMMAPLFRHRRIVILTFCSVFAVAILVAWVWAARYYVSTMQVVVEQDRSDPAVTPGQSGAVNNKPVTTDQVTSEVALLQGEDMLRSVVGTCGLANEPSLSDILLPRDPAQRKAMKQEGAARSLAKKLKVDPEKTSDVIDVSYGRTGDPAVPACVLQTLSKLYLEKHLQLRRPAGSTSFFADETEKYRQALAGAEERLTDFSRDQGVAAPDVLRADIAQQAATSEAALYEARQAIAADEKRIENLKAQLQTTPARSTTAEVSNSSNLLMQNLQADLLAAQIKRTQLMLKYDPSYPLVQEVDQEIAETQDAIARAQDSKFVNRTTDRDGTYEFLREDQARTEADLASRRATAAALTDSIKNLRLETVRLDIQAVKQAALIREAKADEGSYLLYLSKREEERTSDALDQKSIADVAIAVPPVVPVLPAHSPFLVMFLGFFAAVFVSVAAAFVAEYLDPSFRTPADVMDTLSIPVLASMPKKAA